MNDFITFALEGDIGQLPDVFLVQLHGLGSGDHIVGHVAVAAPVDEGTPVDVQVAAVHGGTTTGALVQNHFHKVWEGDLTVCLPDMLGLVTFTVVHYPVLVSGRAGNELLLNLKFHNQGEGTLYWQPNVLLSVS